MVSVKGLTVVGKIICPIYFYICLGLLGDFIAFGAAVNAYFIRIAPAVAVICATTCAAVNKVVTSACINMIAAATCQNEVVTLMALNFIVATGSGDEVAKNGALIAIPGWFAIVAPVYGIYFYFYALPISIEI